MDVRTRRTASVTSAGALAVLTIIVFYASLNKGPATAVTRFHEGLAKSDRLALKQVTGGDLNSPDAVRLRRQVLRALSVSPVFQVTNVKKEGLKAVVVVTYPGASVNSVFFVPFVLHKSEGVWVIDSSETLALFDLQPRG